ncbi:hypothetical protein IT418_01555 [bacterium]|nr:hypothetical protein [bacterium]
MIHTYFLGIEAFVILGYLLGNTLFPRRYSLVFYKFFGVTIFSLVIWYLALFTGTGWTNLVAVVFLIIVSLSALLTIFLRKRIAVPTKKEFLVFIGIELLSYFLYLFLVYIRTFKTDILGTEKLMDVALINAIMKQNHIPIENPWMSGFYMNYYYFGHFILALFQYLFKIPTAIGYNLAISLLGVWIVQAGYLVSKSLRVKDLPAYLVALLMTFGGNLYLFIQAILGRNENQWFASAPRVIEYTINEFPSYSVILGDLHGHYLSYSFFLVGVFLLVDMFLPIRGEGKRTEWIIPKSVFLGILLGHLYLTNSWDVLSLALFGGVIVLAYTWYLRVRKMEPWGAVWRWYQRILVTIGIPLLALSIPQFLSSRSYYLPPVGGVGINTLFSGPGELLMLFGQFLGVFLIAGGAIVFVGKKLKGSEKEKWYYRVEFMLPGLFIFIGGLLIGIVEIFYAKDIFTVLNPPYARTNTVFKIYFHVWAFLSLGTSALLINSWKPTFEKAKNARGLFVIYGLFSLIVGIMLSYSIIGINQYLVPTFKKISISRIVDPMWSNGYSYMKGLHGADYDLIVYLLGKPHATVLEIMTYDSYSYFGRIASYTGMSNVTGWPLHNVQWYNGYEGKGKLIATNKLSLIEISQRVTDIETMYTSTDVAKLNSLLEKYNVRYVIFGDQEFSWAKDKGKTLNVEVYNSLCQVEWQQDGTTLFACR